MFVLVILREAVKQVGLLCCVLTLAGKPAS